MSALARVKELLRSVKEALKPLGSDARIVVRRPPESPGR
jgi:hypothetical protein